MDQNDPDLTDAWRTVLDTIAPHQPNRAWLSTCDPVTVHDELAIIAVPDEFTRTQVEGRLRAEIEGALTRVYGRKIGLGTTINPALVAGSPEHEQREKAQAAAAPQPAEPPRGDLSPDRHDDLSTIRGLAPVVPLPGSGIDQPAPPALHADPPEFHDSDRRPNRSAALEARLNPKYTFETFVIGSSNRFPHAAAVAVAEAPGKAYNPLLVYGESGLGKTHLLHAIGHYVRSLYTGAKVRYVSSEEFTNEFINAIRDDKQDQFKRRYRDVDVLLIDDI
ncbi:MAG TPA: DnaA/Hda family protein, partial [Nocardioides sp.]|nr:DnaA/Hda family protein [Nocardioides sp.]